MNHPTTLALFDVANWWRAPLIVLIGIILGALVTSLAVQGATKLVTGQKVPSFFLNIVRFLGGLTGCLIALMLLSKGGGGGWGFGSGNGLGEGKGPGDGSASYSSQTQSKNKNDKEKPAEKEKPAKPQVLRIEVLNDKALERLGQGDNLKRCYRVSTPEGPKYMDLAELKKFINPTGGEPVWKHLELVIYTDDSPAVFYPQITDLEQWAHHQLLANSKEEVKVDKEVIDGKAPAK